MVSLLRSQVVSLIGLRNNDLIETRNTYAHRPIFKIQKDIANLIHHTINDNKMVVNLTQISEDELHLFYGKFYSVYTCIIEIVELIAKGANTP